MANEIGMALGLALSGMDAVVAALEGIADAVPAAAWARPSVVRAQQSLARARASLEASQPGASFGLESRVATLEGQADRSQDVTDLMNRVTALEAAVTEPPKSETQDRPVDHSPDPSPEPSIEAPPSPPASDDGGDQDHS